MMVILLTPVTLITLVSATLVTLVSCLKVVPKLSQEGPYSDLKVSLSCSVFFHFLLDPKTIIALPCHSVSQSFPVLNLLEVLDLLHGFEKMDMDLSKLLHGFVKVRSIDVDLSKLFNIFLALLQTKPN